jgi:chemotaxis protein methyltransferase CheR
MMFDEIVSVEVVRHFCHIANRRLGVELDAKAEALVPGRVAKRLKQLQLPLDEYLNRLKEDEHCDEVVGFLDVMRPRPARFFARRSDFKELHALLRQALADGRRRFRLWSAGCGSGEEPYAMAMTALDAVASMGLAPETVDIKVLASDLSPRVLQRGKKGIFDEAQLPDLPEVMRTRYFSPVAEGMAVSPEVRSLVVFRRLNLTRLPFPMTGPLDAIFCHDGLAPLLLRVRQTTVEAIKAILAKQGMLCTGLEDTVEVEAAPAKTHSTEEFNWDDLLRSVRTPGHC